ncbi:polyketide synthase [Sclerotinia borealis F-4128]|uniref:Polyketide synthase n=1 Tax=Sclerotinia borealis (strain F-4128) TaxID=1432307 RepID=W9CLK2_SCLBF|nr:polyketide synthase [Sclerotinia borealis F-4128]
MNPTKEVLDLPQDAAYDLVILKGANTLMASLGDQRCTIKESNLAFWTLSQALVLPQTHSAIDVVFKSLEVNQSDSKPAVESEFVERDGTLFVHRVVTDVLVNEFKRAEVEGAQPVLKIGTRLKEIWNICAIILKSRKSYWNSSLCSRVYRYPVSGIVGNKLQANYSTGNTFLDAFTQYHQSLGLQANSVDLGLIEDVSHVAERVGIDARFDKIQWTPVTASDRHKDEKASINASSQTQLIAGIGFSLPEDSNLAHEDYNNDGASQGDEMIKVFRIMCKSGADEAALVKVCVEVVAAQFTKILQLETEMETAKPLLSYGLDSLAAVELAKLDSYRVWGWTDDT